MHDRQTVGQNKVQSKYAYEIGIFTNNFSNLLAISIEAGKKRISSIALRF